MNTAHTARATAGRAGDGADAPAPAAATRDRRAVSSLAAMALPFLPLPNAAQRAYIAARLAAPPPAAALGLSDGHRLPGREGATRPAAVLVALVDRPEGVNVLLTERSAALADHPGQISFPGGRVEPSDAAPRCAKPSRRRACRTSASRCSASSPTTPRSPAST
jgi:hypothetical protein